MDPTYPLLPIANFICLFLVLLPLSTLVRGSWNMGVHVLAIWVALESLIRGVNSIVWADNANVIAPVWCDISELRRSLSGRLAWPTI